MGYQRMIQERVAQSRRSLLVWAGPEAKPDKLAGLFPATPKNPTPKIIPYKGPVRKRSDKMAGMEWSKMCKCNLGALRPGWGWMSDLDSVREKAGKGKEEDKPLRTTSTDHWTAVPEKSDHPRCIHCTRPGWATIDDLDISHRSDMDLKGVPSDFGPPPSPPSTSSIFRSDSDIVMPKLSGVGAKTSEYQLPELNPVYVPTSATRSSSASSESSIWPTPCEMNWSPRTRAPRSKPRSKLPKRPNNYFRPDTDQAVDLSQVEEAGDSSAGETSLGSLDNLRAFPRFDPHVHQLTLISPISASPDPPISSFVTRVTIPIDGASAAAPAKEDPAQLRLRFRIMDKPRIHAAIVGDRTNSLILNGNLLSLPAQPQ